MVRAPGAQKVPKAKRSTRHGPAAERSKKIVSPVRSELVSRLSHKNSCLGAYLNRSLKAYLPRCPPSTSRSSARLRDLPVRSRSRVRPRPRVGRDVPCAPRGSAIGSPPRGRRARGARGGRAALAAASTLVLRGAARLALGSVSSLSLSSALAAHLWRLGRGGLAAHTAHWICHLILNFAGSERIVPENSARPVAPRPRCAAAIETLDPTRCSTAHQTGPVARWEAAGGHPVTEN